MARHNEYSNKTMVAWVLATIMSLTCTMAAAAPDLAVQRRDSAQQRVMSSPLRTSQQELPDIRHRMMTSPQPVEIRQQGRSLCVTSRYNQLLPIYSANGYLYSSFRLSKGTNWLSGLPRGSYIINNKKFTIN